MTYESPWGDVRGVPKVVHCCANVRWAWSDPSCPSRVPEHRRHPESDRKKHIPQNVRTRFFFFLKEDIRDKTKQKKQIDKLGKLSGRKRRTRRAGYLPPKLSIPWRVRGRRWGTRRATLTRIVGGKDELLHGTRTNESTQHRHDTRGKGEQKVIFGIRTNERTIQGSHSQTCPSPLVAILGDAPRKSHVFLKRLQE